MWCEKHKIEYEPKQINMPGGITITTMFPLCAQERDRENEQEKRQEWLVHKK
jgi:hypothetical protein